MSVAAFLVGWLVFCFVAWDMFRKWVNFTTRKELDAISTAIVKHERELEAIRAKMSMLGRGRV